MSVKRGKEKSTLEYLQNGILQSHDYKNKLSYIFDEPPKQYRAKKGSHSKTSPIM